MPVAEEKDMLSLDEAAERFSISAKTLRYWIDRRELTRYKRGRFLFVNAQEVQQLIEKKREFRRVD